MKKKLVITLLMATVTATVFVGCGKKDNRALSTEGTEGTAVALCEETEIETETEAETEAVGSPLVYDENGCIVIDTTKECSDESKPKENNKETASNDTDGKETTTKPEPSNGNSNASSGTNNETSAPVETPVETPEPEPTPEPELTPNLCPYSPLNTWIDFGDGWWGFYRTHGGTDYSLTAEQEDAIDNNLSNYMVSEFIDKGYTYDNSSAELVGTYTDTSDVTLTKYHFVLAE